MIYAYHTRSFGLKYTKVSNKQQLLQVWVDSDYAEDRTDRKSSTGYCSIIGGGTISYRSTKQKSTSLSTAEAEFTAMSDACREIVWLRRFFFEIDERFETPTSLMVDNTIAEGWCTGNVSMRNAKHIETRYYFSRGCYEDNTIVPVHVAGTSNIADGFTKPLGRILF